MPRLVRLRCFFSLRFLAAARRAFLAAHVAAELSDAAAPLAPPAPRRPVEPLARPVVRPLGRPPLFIALPLFTRMPVNAAIARGPPRKGEGAVRIAKETCGPTFATNGAKTITRPTPTRPPVPKRTGTKTAKIALLRRILTAHTPATAREAPTGGVPQTFVTSVGAPTLVPTSVMATGATKTTPRPSPYARTAKPPLKSAPTSKRALDMSSTGASPQGIGP